MLRTRPVALGLWAVLALAVSAPPAAAGPGPRTKPTEAVRQLQRERVNALKEHLQGLWERVRIGKDPLLNLIDTLRELADAELELADTPAEEVAALEIAVARFREVEKDVEEWVPAGVQQAQRRPVAQVRAARLKVEIELEKRKPAKR